MGSIYQGPIEFAVVGDIATRLYMPERFTSTASRKLVPTPELSIGGQFMPWATGTFALILNSVQYGGTDRRIEGEAVVVPCLGSASPQGSSACQNSPRPILESGGESMQADGVTAGAFRRLADHALASRPDASLGPYMPLPHNGSDRAKTYGFIPIEKSQSCLGHVDRHFQRMGDRGGESGIVGQWGKAELDKFFHN